MSTFWYSKMELEPGKWTREKAAYWSMALPRVALRNMDLSDRKVLDIGAVDGMISTLLCRMGADRVIAVDCCDYSDQVNLIQQCYGVQFEYIPRVGTLSLVDRMIELWKFGDRKFTTDVRQGHDRDFAFDVVVCSGVMYHVYSPLHLIGALRTLVRPGGIVILETAIVPTDQIVQIYNYLRRGHYIYAESDTWFHSPDMIDYQLRSFCLRPIDFLFRDQKVILPDGMTVGRGTIVCRAEPEPIPHPSEHQMNNAALNFEYDILFRKELEAIKIAKDPVGYAPAAEPIYNGELLDLYEMAVQQKSLDLPAGLDELRLSDAA